MTTNQRASIFENDDLDVAGFAPTPRRPKPDAEGIKKLAQDKGFRDREPGPKAVPKAAPERPVPAALSRQATTTMIDMVPGAEEGQGRTPVPPSPQAEPILRRRRRHVTGRNQQINIKATPVTIERLYAEADRRGWVLGELLDHAVTLLEREAT